MAAGAAYDWAFALGILAFPRWSAATMGLALPPDPVYLHLNAIFLLLLGAAFLARAWAEGRPAAFLGLALGDLAFAVAHAALLLRARRSP
jgi:hypothetical protein